MEDSINAQAGAPVETRPRRRSLKALIAFTMVLGFLSLLAWGLVKAQSGPLQSGPAPDFTLTTFDNQTLRLSDLRGRVVVINFWASWCVPCRQEADYLERTWQKYKDQGVIFIGVDYADAEKEARKFIAEFGVTYYNGPDMGTKISQAYNIQGIPETFYVDKNGELRGVHIGPIPPPQLDEKIEELLAEPVSFQE